MHKSNNHILPLAWCPRLTPGQLLHANTCSFLNQPKVIFLVPLTGVLGTERDTAVLLIASCWPSSILCRVSTASLQCIFHYFPSSFTTCHSKRADACLPEELFLLLNVTLLEASFFLLCPSPPSVTESLHSQNSCPPWHQVHRVSREFSLQEQALCERCDPAAQHRVFGAELEGEQLL